jgi:parallel beta-helix repeat protein
VVIPLDTEPYLYDTRVEGITIKGFRNNGLFGEHLDGFVWDDIESIDNLNYGIFPVLSKNGVISNSHSTGSTLDSALWVETSENVLVTGNLVENSVNGIEVSNSDDVLVIDNEMRNNTLGLTVLFLPDIFDNKGSLLRIDAVNNWIHDNNKENTARPGSILSFIPRGIGALYVGADDSLVSGNLVEGNDFVGIAVVDYCLPFQDTPFDCSKDDDVTPEFLAGQAAENNRVVGNVLVENGTKPNPDPPEPPNPFAPFAADLTLLTVPPPLPPLHGNCYEENEFETYFSFFDTVILGDPDPDPPMCP